ncbi:MAG: ribosome small subunit-dependent GTPase A [Acidimicrobiales bacterium]|nr:ribosome small subunit-dependent GTPase A [Acidimicrobiales bacterium]
MTALDALGWDEDWATAAATTDGVPARVVRQDRGWVQVAGADGESSARTRADRVGTPVVGDWVTVVDDEVATVLPRRNELRRADPRGEGVQVLAANLDRVLVVLGCDRPVKDGRIQRAVIQAHDAGAEPLVVLTKADVVDDPRREAALVAERHPGLDVVIVSAHTGMGIDELRDRVTGGLDVLVGESGAGKSSLLNAIADADLAGIGDVRAADAKGRHTTTRREMHRLDGGGLVVDTPGVRAIGLYAEPGAVDAAFPDVMAATSGCRFADCTHDHEPGCAVSAAVASGALAADRLDDYRALQAEAEQSLLPDHERRRRR